MPVTPFLGLSVFVHLSIILYYRFTHRSNEKKMVLKKIRNVKNQRSFVAFCIFVVMFLVVAVNAGLLVRSSIFDRHSSIIVVSHILAEIKSSSPPTDSLVEEPNHNEISSDGVNGVDDTNINNKNIL